MQTKKSRKPVKPVTVILYIFLIALAVIYVAPLLWMLSVSFKDNAGVMAAPFALPEVFHWENYQQAWTMGKLGTALVNSVLVCGITLVVSLFLEQWQHLPLQECVGNYQKQHTHFPDRNDGSGTLYPDSAVRTFCRAGID